MGSLIPIKFRFDSSLEYDISQDIIDFYLKLSNEVFNHQLNIPKDKKFKSISIKEGDLDINPRIVAELFSKKINKEHSSAFNIKSTAIFLIDLSKCKGIKPFYTLIIEQLLPLLGELNSANKSLRYPKFFILLETFYEKESYFNLLQQYIESGLVCILGFNNDQGVYSWKKRRLQKVANFDNKISNLKRSAYELIEYKLIRKVGHFKREFNGDHIACQQFFYNGEFCKDEVFELVNENLLTAFKDKNFNPDYIVFHCPNSPWLKESIIRCSNTLTLLKQSNNEYQELNIKDCFELEDIAEKIQDKCDVLFVVDLINSGATFVEAVQERILTHFPNAKIKGLSILCTNIAVNGNEKIPNSKTIKKRVAGSTSPILIDYLIEVEQIYFDVANSEKCPMCRYDLMELKDITYDGGLKLSSHEMWLVCDTAGYKQEIIDSTNKRVLHPELPNTIKVIKKNGPFLAYKFYQNIEKLFPDFETRPKVVVFPDETSNKKFIKRFHKENGRNPELSDSPSGFYANCLKELLGFEIFGIPRKIITELEEGRIPIDNLTIDSKYKEFSRNIQNLPSNFILIDEFYFSGLSLDNIITILRKYNKKPKCFFPLMNYGLQSLTEKQRQGKYKNILFTSFYEFTIN